MDNKMTTSTMSKTPSRSKRHPHHAMSPSLPRTPLMKTPSRSSSRGVRTVPRLTSPLTLRSPVIGSAQTTRTMSPSYNDRFIPNRAKMNIDLCRASLLSAEKHRLESIGHAAARQRRKMCENAPPNSSSLPTTPQAEHDTPLQAEFRRRMKGALFNISLEDLVDDESMTPISSRSANAREPHCPTLESIIAPNLSSNTERSSHDLSYLAYASLPELQAECDESVGVTARRESQTRLMAFRDENRHDGFHTRSSRDAATTRVVTTDPFAQDQLRVLQRSASKSSSGRSLSFTGDDIDFAGTGLQSVAGKIGRRIPTAPTRILDAPDFVDDYYLNLISWSKENILAVALGKCVYLWNGTTGDIQHLVTLPGEHDYVTSVSWATTPGYTKYLAVGTFSNMVQLWDTEAGRRVRNLTGHSGRVSALAWNQQMLSSGGRDSIILQHDVRSASHITSRYRGHTQEVCGLKWNDDGTALASGGNENYLCIWDVAMSHGNNSASRARPVDSSVAPRLLLSQHKAAVKALAWCPFSKDLLASGGGTADRTIKFWNTSNGTMLNSIDTGSQVCSLIWSKHKREIVSSHGFSENQLILWKYPTMTKVQEFKGHTARVLNMEMSPDGQIVSAAADETLRFWDVFGPPPSSRRADKVHLGLGDFRSGPMTIR